MSRNSRWRPPPAAARHIADELALAVAASDPWHHLQRAHILAQPWAAPHVRVHAVMLSQARLERRWRESVAQAVLMTIAGPASLARQYPTGHKGTSDMGLRGTAPVPADLQQILDTAADRASVAADQHDRRE